MRLLGGLKTICEYIQNKTHKYNEICEERDDKMIEPKLIDYDLDFRSLAERFATDMIVVHHTGNSDRNGNPIDDDLSAEEIHEIHKNLGWSGIGYHFVVRKNGDIEIGRPDWARGAHAENDNGHTIGVHLCGNFEIAVPTQQQIESAAYLIGWLCERYDIVPDYAHVVGHRELNATACPGENLYKILQTIRGKSIWYQQNYREGD